MRRKILIIKTTRTSLYLSASYCQQYPTVTDPLFTYFQVHPALLPIFVDTFLYHTYIQPDFQSGWKAEQNLPENKTLSRCKYFFLAVFHSLPPRVVFSKLCFTFPRVKLSRSRIMKKNLHPNLNNLTTLSDKKKNSTLWQSFTAFSRVSLLKKVYILELGCEKTEGFDRFRTFLCI